MLQIEIIFWTILHFACNSGNLELVTYIISLKEIDIESVTIFLSFIKFQTYKIYDILIIKLLKMFSNHQFS